MSTSASSWLSSRCRLALVHRKTSMISRWWRVFSAKIFLGHSRSKLLYLDVMSYSLSVSVTMNLRVSTSSSVSVALCRSLKTTKTLGRTYTHISSMPKSTLWNGQPAIVSISSTKERSQQKINLNSKGCFTAWISSLLLRSSSSALMTKPGSAAVCLQSSCLSRLSQTAKLLLWSASVLEAWSWCTASESWSICTDKGISRLVLSSMTFNCGQERTSSIPKRHMRSAWERPTTAASSTANSTTYILVKIMQSAQCNLWCSQVLLL